ncbi:MAG: hypothetical protein ACWGQW_01225 [bacterium]
MSDCVLCDKDTEVVVETELVIETLETTVQSAVVVETAPVEVLETSTMEISVPTEAASVLEVLTSGPQAVPEGEVAYSKRVDFVDDTTLYKGEAEPGTLETEAKWRIQRITFVGADEDVVIEWANGSGSFVHAWSNRAGLSYS